MADNEQTLTPAEHSDLQTRIDEMVTAVSRHAYVLEKDENPTTSNLAQAIKDVAKEFTNEHPNVNIEVHVEEFSLDAESRSGADLYISIVIKGRRKPVSKGILVQAKRREKLNRKAERRRLRNQCNRMRTRMPYDSYVWIFDEQGTHCMKAPKSSDPKLRDLPTSSISVGELIADGVACWRGDESKGIDVGPNVGEALLNRMKQLSVPTGVALVVR